MKVPRLSAISLFLSLAIFAVSLVLLRVSLQGGNSLNRLTNAIRGADSLGINFLDDDERGFFDLSEEEFDEFQKLLEGHYFTTEFQTMCHEPLQELQFRRRGSTLLAGTLCLKCVNFEVNGIVFGSPTVTVMDEQAEDPMTLPRIQRFLEATRARESAQR